MRSWGWAPLLRVARRDASRHKGRSLLVVVLVAVPVAAMSASLTIGDSTARTPEEEAAATMGEADLSLQAQGIPPAEWQAVLPPAEWQAVLPPGGRWTPVQAYGGGTAAIIADDELFEPALFVADLADPLLAGLAELVDGRAARGPDEVVVSTALAADLGVEVGDRLPLARPDRVVTVVGTGGTPWSLDQSQLFVPWGWAEAGAGGVPPEEGGTRWLIDVGSADPRQVAAELEERFPSPRYPSDVVSLVPDVVGLADEGGSLDVLTRAHVLSSEPPPDDQVSITFVAGTLALAWTGAVAAAAFTVGARRRLREVGLVAAAGGAPRHLRRLLLADGVVLGLVGSLSGAALGVLVAALARPHLDRLVGYAVDDLRVPWPAVAGAAAVGVAAAVLAALVPARSAARVPVLAALAALAGLRPRRPRARSWLIAGVVALAAGVVLCWRGGRSGSEWSVNAGVLLVVLGVAATTGPLLGLVSRLAGIAPLALRLAARDAGRSRGRSGPATVAAMLALAGAVGGSAMLTSSQAQAERAYVPFLRDDQIVLSLTDAEPAPTPADLAAVVEAATAALPGAVGGVLARAEPAEAPRASVFAGTPRVVGLDGFSIPRPNAEVAVGDAATLEALDAVDAAAALEDGRVVALNGGLVDADGTVTLWRQTERGAEELATLPAVEVEGEPLFGVPRYLISRATAEALGLAVAPAGVLLRAPAPVTDADVRRVTLSVLEAVPAVPVSAQRETGQQAAGSLVLPAMLGAGALVALFVVALVSALSREELRPHLGTLAAVGAAPRARRRFAAAQSGLLAGTAALLAVPAGLIPAATLLRSRSGDIARSVAAYPSASAEGSAGVVIPWLAIAGLVVAVICLGTLTGALSRMGTRQARAAPAPSSSG